MGTNISDIYVRISQQIDVDELTQQNVVGWLTSGDVVKKPSLGVRILAQQIEDQAVSEIESRIEMARDLNDFKLLDDVKIEKSKKQIEQKRKEIEIELRDTVKETLDFNTYQESIRTLKDLNPQRLGGIKSGQTRRAKAGFRFLFNEFN